MVKRRCICYGSGTCIDNSKLTKISCDGGGTWTYNIDGDDGSNGFYQGDNVLIVKQVIQDENNLCLRKTCVHINDPDEIVCWYL